MKNLRFSLILVLLLLSGIPMASASDLTLQVDATAYQKGSTVHVTGTALPSRSVDIFVYYVINESSQNYALVKFDTVMSNTSGAVDYYFTLALNVDTGSYFVQGMMGQVTSAPVYFNVTNTAPETPPPVTGDKDMFEFATSCGEALEYNDVYVSPEWQDVVVTIQYNGTEPIDGVFCKWKSGGTDWVSSSPEGTPTFLRSLNGGTYFDAGDSRLCIAQLSFKARYLDPNQDYHHEILVFDRKWRDTEGIPRTYSEETGSYLYEMHVFFWYKVGQPDVTITGDLAIGSNVTVLLTRSGNTVSVSELLEVRVINSTGGIRQYISETLSNPVVYVPEVEGRHFVQFFNKSGELIVSDLFDVGTGTTTTPPPTSTPPPRTEPPEYDYTLSFSSNNPKVGNTLTVTLLENGTEAPASIIKTFVINGAGVGVSETGINSITVMPTMADTLSVNILLQSGKTVQGQRLVSENLLPLEGVSFTPNEEEGKLVFVLPTGLNVNYTVERKATETSEPSVVAQNYLPNNTTGVLMIDGEEGYYRAGVTVQGHVPFESPWVYLGTTTPNLITYEDIIFEGNERRIVLVNLSPKDTSIIVINGDDEEVSNSNLPKGDYIVELRKTNYTTVTVPFSVVSGSGGTSFPSTRMLLLVAGVILVSGVLVLFVRRTKYGVKKTAPKQEKVQESNGMPSESVKKPLDRINANSVLFGTEENEIPKVLGEMPNMGGKRR